MNGWLKAERVIPVERVGPGYHGGDGRRFRTFNVIDDFSREALAVEVDLNLPATRVIRTLGRVAAWRRYPTKLRMDNARRVSGSKRSGDLGFSVALIYGESTLPAQFLHQCAGPRLTQKADDLFLGKPLLHVQSGEVDSRPPCYSKPWRVVIDPAH